MLSIAQPALQSPPVPPIQEAAVLFSAGHAAAAAAVLSAAASDTHRDPRAAAMLLELDPEWQAPPPLSAPGTFALEGVLAAGHEGVRALAAHAQARRAFAIDMGRIERIEYVFAGALTAMLRGFHAAGRRVILVNCRELEVALLEAMGAGRYVSFLRRAPERVAA
jgi:hypothetical protein